MWGNRFNLHPSVVFDYSSSFNILTGNAKISIDSNSIIRSFCSILCGDSGKLEIGMNVFFNNYCSINCLHEISIGDDTIFGEGVRLYDHNHGFKCTDLPFWKQDMKRGKIVIGKNCWIGANSVILSNVEIGDNVVIGANNLIFRSIPSNTIVKSSPQNTIEELNFND